MPVSRCPRDEIEWNERASALDCAALESFDDDSVNMYHCALTGDGARLVEVCAPSVNIHGTCNNMYYINANSKPLLKTDNLDNVKCTDIRMFINSS